jgi:2,4-dienoyl-CoA reductase-like NADH-dependent reductase (Old Yellow Enzyme family)
VHLFASFTLRDVAFKNRIVVSPMCEYSSDDGFATDWHLVHLGSRAVGGAGLVLTEAAAVTAAGRISPQDLGIYHDAHIDALAKITRFIDLQGAVAGIQLAHAGRKAATPRPWENAAPTVAPEHGGWEPVAPSAIPFAPGYRTPRALTLAEIAETVAAFAAAARRAHDAGFRVAEIHGAHGYLIHEFLSPLSNTRTDAYGGAFENRTRLAREVSRAVRAVWPEGLPLFFRISASDWAEGGWTLDESVELAKLLKADGVDLIDASSGGAIADAKIAVGPGYQVPFAERIRRDAAIPTGAVGMITTAEQAEAILGEGKADLIFIARELLRDPYWPLHAARALGVDLPWPVQYERAKPRR